MYWYVVNTHPLIQKCILYVLCMKRCLQQPINTDGEGVSLHSEWIFVLPSLDDVKSCGCIIWMVYVCYHDFKTVGRNSVETLALFPLSHMHFYPSPLPSHSPKETFGVNHVVFASENSEAPRQSTKIRLWKFSEIKVCSVRDARAKLHGVITCTFLGGPSYELQRSKDN